MNTFNEVLLSRLGEKKYQTIKHPKILHFFYELFGEFYDKYSFHKKDDITNYTIMLEKEFGLSEAIRIEFLIHLKNIYKTFFDEISLEVKSIDNLRKSYLRDCYESHNDNTSSLVKIIVNAYWCYNNSILYRGKKVKFKYPTKDYLNSFLKNTIADIKVIILFIENDIDKLKELDIKDSSEAKINSDKLNVSNIESNVSKIQWKQNLTDLVFLFDELIRLGFITNYKNINKLIANHFTGKNSEIKPNEIADLRSKLKNKNYPLNPSEAISDIGKKLRGSQ